MSATPASSARAEAAASPPAAKTRTVFASLKARTSAATSRRGVAKSPSHCSGSAGQAVQNANLMTGQPETAGLAGLPLWP